MKTIAHRYWIALLLIIVTTSPGLAQQQRFNLKPKPKPKVLDTGKCEVKLLPPEIDQSWLATELEKLRNRSPEELKQAQAIQTMGLDAVALNQSIIKMHNLNPGYTNKLNTLPIKDQHQTGQCWDFSECTVQEMVSQGKLPAGSELSETYVWFYSLLEQGNLYFERIVQNADSRLTAEVTRNLLTPSFSEGGEFAQYAAIVDIYGLVPKNLMPDTSGTVLAGQISKELFRQMASTGSEMYQAILDFRQSVSTSPSGELSNNQRTALLRARVKLSQDKSVELEKKLREIKTKGMAAVLQILTDHLRTPPSSFELPVDAQGRIVAKENAQKSGIKMKTFTPQEYRDYIGFKSQDYVVVSSSPLQPYGQHFVFPGSTFGVPSEDGKIKDLETLNLPIERLAELVKTSIDAKFPVWYGADAGNDIDNKSGIMHPDIRQYSEAYGKGPASKTPDLTRTELLYFRVGSPNHAMVFVGYDRPDPKSKQAFVKALTQNSWGVRAGDNGFYHTYYEWFAKHVYEIVVPFSILSDEEKALFKQKAKPIYQSDFY